MMATTSDKTFVEIKIDTTCIKTIANGFHLMQKIGREVILEFDNTAMALRSINDSKSAFCVVQLHSSFFDSYQLFAHPEKPYKLNDQKSNQSTTYACKLPIKPLCQLFRNLKSMKSITLSMKQRADRNHLFSFEFLLNNGIVRSHHFFYQDCDVVNAIYEENDQQSCFQVRPKVMLQLLDHFHRRSPEVLLTLSAQTFALKSYYSPEIQLLHQRGGVLSSSTGSGLSAPSRRVPRKHLLVNTGVQLSVQELESFDYHESEEDLTEDNLVFATKEVGAFVAFCELSEFESFTVHCTSGGSPMKLSTTQELLSAVLIVATIEYVESVNQTASIPAQPPRGKIEEAPRRASEVQRGDEDEQRDSEAMERRSRVPEGEDDDTEEERQGGGEEGYHQTLIVPEEYPSTKNKGKTKSTNRRKRWLEDSSDED